MSAPYIVRELDTIIEWPAGAAADELGLIA